MTDVQTLTVSPEEAELRLDRWFKRHFPALTHGLLEKWLRTGNVRVDGKRAKSNQRLDAGTNPPAIQAILDPIRDWVAGGKLLGAGGGGFLLLFAKDTEAAHRLRNHLEQHPPNPRARFINLSLSETGLQVTRS